MCTPHALAIIDMRVLEVADAHFLALSADTTVDTGRVSAIAACAYPEGGESGPPAITAVTLRAVSSVG